MFDLIRVELGRRNHLFSSRREERGWLIDGDTPCPTWWTLPCSPVLTCLQAPSGSSPSLDVFCFFPRWLFSASLSPSFCALSTLCLLYSGSPSPVMHIFCLRQGESGLWLGPGRVMYWEGLAHPGHVKSSCWLLVLLFHLVSICLCILLGPRVGGLSSLRNTSC